MNDRYPHGRNVEQIRAQATRVVRGRIPAEVERQRREAEYAVKCIAGVMASPADVRADLEARGVEIELPRIPR